MRRRSSLQYSRPLLFKLRYSRPAVRLWAVFHPKRARLMRQVIRDLDPVLERLRD